MTTLETDVEELDVHSAMLVQAGSPDPYIAALVKTLRLADADQLDVLDKAYPNLVYAERERRVNPKRLAAVAAMRPRSQCPECGWPVYEGYQNAFANDGDVDPIGHCRNTQCDYQY